MDKTKVQGIDIITAVDSGIAKIRTKSLDISFNELLDMFVDGELKINPEYQRLFRWSPEKQSRFIESLILEMPIPPVFVIEIEEGKYELIDGLQRISSYLHFRGKHPDRTSDDGEPTNLVLENCDIIKELNGFSYEELPATIKFKLKRNFVRLEIIRKESDIRLRYYMFKRLNTGGEILSEQEIRNCTIRLLGDRFNNFLIDLSTLLGFTNCISNISDEQKKSKYDQELVLRFFTLKNNRDSYKHDVADFMTDYMEKLSEPDPLINFDYVSEKQIFEKTFDILNKALGEKVFSPANDNGTLVARFAAYHFEAFTLGVQKSLSKLNTSDECISNLKNRFEHIKKEPEFRRLTTGGGKNTAKELRSRIEFVEKQIESIL